MYTLRYRRVATKKKEMATTAGLEPARAKPKRFQVFLLNRSDKLPFRNYFHSCGAIF